MSEKLNKQLVYSSSFPDGFCNVDVEFTATEEGLECDLTGSVISWEWLDRAREIISKQAENKS